MATEQLVLPSLFEYKGLVKIPKRLTDRNMHLNNAGFMTLCERQRAAFIKACGFSLKKLQTEHNIALVLRGKTVSNYLGQAFPGDTVEIATRAENLRSKIEFYQAIKREGERIYDLQCSIVGLRPNGRLTRIPDIVGFILNQLNAPFMKS